MAKVELYPKGSMVTVYHRKPGTHGSPIQMRGTVAAFDGERLLLLRQFKGPGRAYDGLHALQEKGDHGSIELRRKAWVCRRRYLRKDGQLVGELFNIQTPTRFGTRGVEYNDLEIDVAYLPHHPERVLIQDDEALEQAVQAGYVSPELAQAAREIAHELARRLRAWDGQAPLDWDVRPPEAAEERPAEEPQPGAHE